MAKNWKQVPEYWYPICFTSLFERDIFQIGCLSVIRYAWFPIHTATGGSAPVGNVESTRKVTIKLDLRAHYRTFRDAKKVFGCEGGRSSDGESFEIESVTGRRWVEPGCGLILKLP